MEPGTVCWEQSADRRAYCLHVRVGCHLRGEWIKPFSVWNAHRTHPFPPKAVSICCVSGKTAIRSHRKNASELRRGTVQAKAYARSLCHCEHLYLCADVVELAIISEVCKANASELIKGTVQPKLAPMLSEKEIQYLQQTNQCSWRIVLKFYKKNGT